MVLKFRCSSDFYQRSIQELSKIAGPLTLMLRTSLSTDSSTSVTQLVDEYDGVDDGSGKGGGQLVEKVEKPQRPEKWQRLSVWRNVYQITDPLSIRYKELELPLELRQFFELFLLGPKALSRPLSLSIIVKAKLMELLMLCHVFSLKESVFFELLCTKFLSTKLTSSVHCFNSGDALRKKTSKPHIKAKMLDGWEDVEGTIKACLTFLGSSKLS